MSYKKQVRNLITAVLITLVLVLGNNPALAVHSSVPEVRTAGPLASSVTISGPAAGVVRAAYTFTATVEPLTTTLPITYTWAATGQAPVTHTNGLSNTVTFTWTEPGVQVITVTADNAEVVVTATHRITISAPPAEVSIGGPAVGAVRTAYAFTATVEPPTATVPIAYTWEATGQTPITDTGGLTNTVIFSWTEPGVQAITVTAANAEGAVTATHRITISAPSAVVDIGGPTAGFVQEAYTFTATVEPPTTTLPISYTWEATGQAPVTDTDGLSSTVTFTWTEPGVQVITVTADNAEVVVTATHRITISAPPAEVSIGGPTAGVIRTAYTFTAMVEPATATLPLTYTWEATGQDPVTHTGGLSDSVTFAWTLPGTQAITVTVANAAGFAVAHHTVTLEARIFLPLVIKRWPPIPDKPVLNPIDNADGDGNYQVTWNASYLATTYTLEEDDDPAFGSPVTVYDHGTDLSWSASGKLVGIYYYRVKATNSWGDSGWSNVQAVVVPAPATPVLNPIDNADGDGNYQVIWNASYVATGYVLEEDDNPDFTSPATVYSGPDVSWTAVNKLVGTYYYRVKATNPAGESGWSSVQSAVVIPPGTPVLNPIANADGDGNYQVTWNPSYLATTYTLQEDDNSSFTSPATVYDHGTGTSWSASGKAAGTYYYRVKASNPSGDSDWSNVQSVSVLPGILYSQADTDVFQGTPSENDGSYSDMWAGYYKTACFGGSASGIARPLVRFNLASIPAGTAISQATLSIRLVAACWPTAINGQSRTVTAYRLSSGWEEYVVTWNTQPGQAEARGAVAIPLVDDLLQWYSINLTDLVRGWVNGTWPNDGLMLRGPESSGNTNFTFFAFATREWSSYRPYLTLTYGGVKAFEGQPAIEEGISSTRCENVAEDIIVCTLVQDPLR